MSFPPGTEMFQFPGFASWSLCIQPRIPHSGWVSPFGNPRINDRSHLPAAYRSVPRPSSPSGAKASTERPLFTHHCRRPRAGPRRTIGTLSTPSARPGAHASNRTNGHAPETLATLAALARSSFDEHGTSRTNTKSSSHVNEHQEPRGRCASHGITRGVSWKRHAAHPGAMPIRVTAPRPA